ncbi:acyl CoA:acetate/3-ketoacid CoA transferase [Sporomusa malonica]|uniref:Propionate CoA-transferase n=1 Tax=Sporomusa malonica TaxID=112901 RepID=A0A1W2E6X7_9FIRM|nr:acyl CoA:acetate/3-ketoacid CoA transferase [Sporomusa malonica]SMD05533.1 propionate CoA-transferase [Sporomusa malonica]
MAKFISAEQVIKYIKDGSTIYTPGITLGGFAEEVALEIEKSFLETGYPRDLTIYYPSGIGNRRDRGFAHLSHEGLLKRTVGGHYKGCGPALEKLVKENKVEAYNFPQGIVTTLPRNVAARRPGIISKVGLGTFVDPRLEGGKLNARTRECEDLVEVIQLENEEWLYYKAPKFDIAIIRGSVADENGNISLYRESYFLEQLSVAQAAKACGGIVIAQVEQVVKAGTLHPKEVKVPGIMVDYVVVAKSENHWQTGQTYFNPVFCGDIKVPLDSIKAAPLDERKVIARRADMELFPGAVINIGVGIPEVASAVTAEEGISHNLHMTTEAGGVGGLPAGMHDFGCCYNADAIIEMGHQFDFFNGGGIDVAILGIAQVDRHGNVNVSQVNGEPIGCGGFIDITQNAKKVVFCGTFTAGGLKEQIADRKLNIVQEGRSKKFLADVEQVTFSGKYAVSVGQNVMYVTERAVFELTPEGVELIEIAPGIDLDKDVLELMDFRPIIRNVKTMAPEIFQELPGVVAKVFQSRNSL